MKEQVWLRYGKEEEDFHFDHVTRTEPFGRNNHFHSTYEIYYLIAGQRAYFIKDRSYLVTPGSLVFINKQEVHKTSDVEVPGHERIVVNFSDRMLEGGSPPPPLLLSAFHSVSRVLPLKLAEQGFVQALMAKLSRELSIQKEGYELYIRLLLAELLLFAGRLADETGSPEEPAEIDNPVHRKITEVVRHLNARFHEPIRLSDLSEQFYVSPYYLSRMFRKVTGFTLIEYVHTMRIKEAQKLLAETPLKVIEISEAVGFENLAHFGRVFKKLNKVPPHQYRKRHRADKLLE
ncbi:AraC family transcriptional regulator [Paenibacillus sp. CC-CFT747]|nr:AraC family transcriptional regulator [Paenibacillus sp. CC-CFT747]